MEQQQANLAQELQAVKAIAFDLQMQLQQQQQQLQQASTFIGTVAEKVGVAAQDGQLNIDAIMARVATLAATPA